MAKSKNSVKADSKATPKAKASKPAKVKPEAVAKIEAELVAEVAAIVATPDAAASESAASVEVATEQAASPAVKPAPVSVTVDGCPVRVIGSMLAISEQKRHGLADHPVASFDTLAKVADWFSNPLCGRSESEKLGQKWAASMGRLPGWIVIDTDGSLDGWARYVIAHRREQVAAIKAAKPKMTDAEKAAAKATKDAAKAAKRAADQAEADKARAEVAAAEAKAIHERVEAFAEQVAGRDTEESCATSRETIAILMRAGVIKNDGTIDETRIRTTKTSTGGVRRSTGVRQSVFDQAATAVVRWCGKDGFTSDQTINALNSMGVSLSRGTIAAQLKGGVVGRYGDPASLNAEQAATLRAFKM